ncbi:chemotaxis protein CheW [Candidatus Binatus sp.]|uniref:chemotaxis protein CheW n=1 Tax=Candidatus Binatus sp. TaxID=2811406 RepID=UPI003C4FDA27
MTTIATPASLSSTRLAVVLVRSGNLFCALPLESVIETLRSPPVTVIAGAPGWVQGVAVIRGATVVVVDLGILLGAGSAELKQARVVTLRVGARVVGLAVESIVGVRDFERTMLAEVPPLLLQAHPEVLTAIGLLDGELMLVLDGSRIITEDELARLENS